MRAKSLIVAAAGFACLAGGMAADSLVPPGPAPKAGLWELRRSTNLALFIAPPRAVEDRQRLSEEYLRHESVMRICQTAEQHKAFVDKTMGMGDCVPQGAQKSDRLLIVDMLCKNADKVHAEFTIDPSEHRIARLVETIMNGADGKPKAHVDAAFESPAHASIRIEMPGSPPGDVPVIMVYDLHWVSADCGKAVTDKPEPAAPPVH